MSPISSDRLNGYPTDTDPNPKGRPLGRIHGYNGYPQSKKKTRAKQAASAPADQTRRVATAARQKEKALRKKRNHALLKIFGVPEPTAIPGQTGLYSRWLKEKGDKKFRFKTLEDMCVHIAENYADDEKEKNWRSYMAEVEPQPDPAEAEAEELHENLEAQSDPRRILDTKDLPREVITEGSVPDNIH